MGTSTEPWALDNERPAHQVDVPPFYLDTTPVTNAAYAGVHRRRRVRRPALVDRGRLGAPAAGRPDRAAVLALGGRAGCAVGFGVARAGRRRRAGDARLLVRGRRLRPLGRAAAADRGGMGEGRPVRPGDRAVHARYPWGDDDPAPERANLGQRHLQPAPAGSYPAGAAPCGARQLIGDVWEWTSSRLPALPGLRAWPYREYSEVFFGPEYKVLRGGAFACARWPAAARSGTGTTRSGGRSSPASARTARVRPGRWRPPDVPASRLPRAAATLRSLLIDPPYGLCRQAWAPRDAAARDGERGRVRRRLVRRRRPGAGQVPAGGADLGRRRRCPTWPG